MNDSGGRVHERGHSTVAPRGRGSTVSRWEVPRRSGHKTKGSRPTCVQCRDGAPEVSLGASFPKTPTIHPLRTHPPGLLGTNTDHSPHDGGGRGLLESLGVGGCIDSRLLPRGLDRRIHHGSREGWGATTRVDLPRHGDGLGVRGSDRKSCPSDETQRCPAYAVSQLPSLPAQGPDLVLCKKFVT